METLDDILKAVKTVADSLPEGAKSGTLDLVIKAGDLDIRVSKSFSEPARTLGFQASEERP